MLIAVRAACARNDQCTQPLPHRANRQTRCRRRRRRGRRPSAGRRAELPPGNPNAHFSVSLDLVCGQTRACRRLEPDIGQIAPSRSTVGLQRISSGRVSQRFGIAAASPDAAEPTGPPPTSRRALIVVQTPRLFDHRPREERGENRFGCALAERFARRRATGSGSGLVAASALRFEHRDGLCALREDRRRCERQRDRARDGYHDQRMADQTVVVQASSTSWSGSPDMCMNLVGGVPVVSWTIRKMLDDIPHARVIVAAPGSDALGRSRQSRSRFRPAASRYASTRRERWPGSRLHVGARR